MALLMSRHSKLILCPLRCPIGAARDTIASINVYHHVNEVIRRVGSNFHMEDL